MCLEAAVAQSRLSRVSRFGPIWPVAPAAASVWQELQPGAPVKSALPAAAVAADVLDVALLELDVELLELELLDEAPALAFEPSPLVAGAADPAPGTPAWAAEGG